MTSADSAPISNAPSTTPLGTALLNALDRVTTLIRTDTELLVKATLGFFLVSLWGLRSRLMTLTGGTRP